MKNVALYFLAAMTLLATTSCSNAGFKRTKSGLLYKIISDDKGEPIKKGEFLKLSVVVKLEDSMLSTAGAPATYIRVDSPRADYSPMEVFTLMRDGDSCVVVQLADSLHKRYGQLPPFIKKHQKIIYCFRVLKTYTNQVDVMADRNADQQKQNQKEIKEVEDYLAANHIIYRKTEKGTYVVIDSPGTGDLIDSGKLVSIRYTGKFLPSGKVFESNMTPPGNTPIKFILGQGRVIPGWDDALRLFRKGGKGTLYIPAYLAYDAQERPGKTPFENLIFDIEVVDVTDAPKTPEKPASSRMPLSRFAPPPGHVQAPVQTSPARPVPQHK